MDNDMRSKVCFLTTRNIFNTTCLPRYAKILGNKFDIIYWDQHGLDENCNAEHYYKFEYAMKYGRSSKLKKLLGYIKFYNFAKRIMKREKYDRIIVLPTQTGMLFYRFLTKNYKKKYLLDIRDYTAENNKVFYWFEKRLIDCSGLISLTSPAYARFLPERDYIISHNITRVDEKDVIEFRNRKKNINKPIVVSCIGSIRFLKQFRRVIDIFKNDQRFILRFIGRGADNLDAYCKNNGIINVVLEDRFSPEKTISYYLESDIIMNLYGNNNPLLDYALSNKLYFAAILGMPILVCPKTYMEEVAVKEGFGFTVDLNDNDILNKLFDYYNSIKWKDFYEHCDRFMEKVKIDEELFIKAVKDFVVK
jgi:hypothetical protein